LPETHFIRQMEQLKELLLKMAGLVEKTIDEVMRALGQRDREAARRIIAGDRRIDDMENMVNDQTILLLATQQPVAVDLRFLTAVMKISAYLERMGDQAVNLAFRTLTLTELDPIPVPPTIKKMAVLAQDMVHRSLNAFVQRQARLAYDVCCSDDEVDDLNRSLLEEMMGQLTNEKALARRAVELILIGRHLERIGDEATNVAEEVVYLVEGRSIKHQELRICDSARPPKSGPDQG